MACQVGRMCAPGERFHSHCDCSKTGELEWIKVKDDFEGGLRYIANNDNVFYFESNHEAPNTKVVRYDLDHPVFKPLRLN